MRIAFFVDKFPAISETFILQQITGLMDRGHQVDVYSECYPPSDDALHSDVEQYGLLDRTFYRQPTPGLTWRRCSLAIGVLARYGWQTPRIIGRTLNVLSYRRAALTGRILLQSEPLLNQGRPSYDVIHAHFAPNGVKAAMLREIGCISGPLVTSFHGYDVNVGDRDHLRSQYQHLFNVGDLYTSNTNFTADRAADLGCPRELIRKLPESMDASRYPFHERRLPTDGPVRLLTVGRLVEKKGIRYAIEAVAKLKDQHPNLRYQIVGDGPLRDELAGLIMRLGVGDRVELLGSKTQDEVRKLHQVSHLFTLPSVTAANGDMEGQGLVLQEAQASGMPVISTLHNGIPEAVLDGESGLLVPERDVQALANAIDWLLNHDERWPEFGRAGRQLVEQQFDQKLLNDRLVEIYHDVQRERPYQPITASNN